MKRSILAASIVLALLASAPAAYATKTFNQTQIGTDGSMSGTFSDNGIVGGAGGFFSDPFEFTLDVGGFISGTISSNLASVPNVRRLSGDPTDIDFLVVRLDNQDFTVAMSGANEFRFLNPVSIGAGLHHLLIEGTSGGNGSYAGTLSFAAAAAPPPGVPEPAAWALMIMGFGGVGASLRAKRRQDLAHA